MRTALLLCGVALEMALEIALRNCVQSNWEIALGLFDCFEGCLFLGGCVWSGDHDRH